MNINNQAVNMLLVNSEHKQSSSKHMLLGNSNINNQAVNMLLGNSEHKQSSSKHVAR